METSFAEAIRFASDLPEVAQQDIADFIKAIVGKTEQLSTIQF